MDKSPALLCAWLTCIQTMHAIGPSAHNIDGGQNTARRKHECSCRWHWWRRQRRAHIRWASAGAGALSGHVVDLLQPISIRSLEVQPDNTATVRSIICGVVTTHKHRTFHLHVNTHPFDTVYVPQRGCSYSHAPQSLIIAFELMFTPCPARLHNVCYQRWVASVHCEITHVGNM